MQETTQRTENFLNFRNLANDRFCITLQIMAILGFVLSFFYQNLMKGVVSEEKEVLH